MTADRPAIYRFLGYQIACYAIGFVGSHGTFQGLADWYVAVNKPGWAPPLWLFVPLWTVLYFVAGSAAFFAFEETTRRAAFVLFWVLMALGAIWPWTFFAWHLTLPATVCSAAYFGVSIATVALIGRSARRAALLLFPIVCWAGYLTALSATVWRLNR